MSLQDKVKKYGEILDKRVRESNSFMTKEDGYLSKPEWHATVIGSGLFVLAYMMPGSLGGLFVIAFLGMSWTIYRALVRPEKITGHLGDVAHEYAYTVASAVTTVVLMELFTDYSVADIELVGIGAALLKTLIGA